MERKENSKSSSGSLFFKIKDHGEASARGMIPSSDLDNGIAQPEKIQGSETGVKKLALETMRQDIRTSTSSMTFVPIPLKFLRPHYGTLKTYYETMEDSDLKKYLADILSVLALTMSAERERESLKYRLLGSEGDIGSRGHEYVRNLAGEISQEYTNRQQQEEATTDNLMELIQQIVAFHIKHNAEPEAVDPLMEVNLIDGKASAGASVDSVRQNLPATSVNAFVDPGFAQESVGATAEVFKRFHEKIKKYCDMTLLACACARTGNALKVQHLLGQCAQHLEEGETHQGPAMLGIATVAFTEELGLEMAIRSLEHLLQYGEQNICHAVSLALGLLCISNPKVNVTDTLSWLSHDIDSGVAMVRIAQGLVDMGKGLLTLAPHHHSERFLLSSAYLEMDQVGIKMEQQMSYVPTDGQRFDKTGTTVIALIAKAGIYFMHDGFARVNGLLQPAPDDVKGGLISDLPYLVYCLNYGDVDMCTEVRNAALQFVHQERALHGISPTMNQLVRFVAHYLYVDYHGNETGTFIIGGFDGDIPRIAVVRRKSNGHSSYRWNTRFACAGGGAGAARRFLCTVNDEDGYLAHLHTAMALASNADPDTGGTITTRLMRSSGFIHVAVLIYNVHQLVGI